MATLVFDLNQVINKCSYQVAPSTMYAIVKTESHGNPLAININGKVKLKYQPHTFKQAVKWVDYLELHGYNIDIGIAQVNIKNAHRFGFKAHDMLKPCHNLMVASVILRNNYIGALSNSTTQKEALQKAISAYNTGNYRSGFNNGYVAKVVLNARQNKED
ncbi:MAG: lytic transglycosylase domain-containing protein [Neisseriaceae bacterium]